MLEACRKAGHRQRARRFGKMMLEQTALPLSPFCVSSLRKALGATNLKALCAETGVAWEAVQACLK